MTSLAYKLGVVAKQTVCILLLFDELHGLFECYISKWSGLLILILMSVCVCVCV